MGLKETIQNAAKTAVKAVGNVAASTTYVTLVTTVYNASAGAASTTYASTAGVQLLFTGFSFREMDGVIVKPEDKMAMIPVKYVSGVVCRPHDRIYEQTSIVWEVVRANLDIAGAMWTLHVRRP